jgi:hypothetical protein
VGLRVSTFRHLSQGSHSQPSQRIHDQPLLRVLASIPCARIDWWLGLGDDVPLHARCDSSLVQAQTSTCHGYCNQWLERRRLGLPEYVVAYFVLVVRADIDNIQFFSVDFCLSLATPGLSARQDFSFLVASLLPTFSLNHVSLGGNIGLHICSFHRRMSKESCTTEPTGSPSRVGS